MPDLTFEVQNMPAIDVGVESEPTGAEIELKDSVGNVLQAENGKYSEKIWPDAGWPETGGDAEGAQWSIFTEKYKIISNFFT